MILQGDLNLAAGYTSRTQQVRRISEGWVAENAYCLNCKSDRLVQTGPNTRTRDFVCNTCAHGYELKSKLGPFSSTVLDGAYATMMQTIREGRTPTFLLLEYSKTWSISRMRAIHHSLITEAAIQPRKPLSQTARRAGWTGCNILLPAIALQGQIAIVSDGRMNEKRETREAFAKLEALNVLSHSNRTWAATILQLTESLNSDTFSLQDMYRFESELKLLFPNNKHVRQKIRQQLQVLRDAGLIRFCGRGTYENTGRRRTRAGSQLV